MLSGVVREDFQGRDLKEVCCAFLGKRCSRQRCLRSGRIASGLDSGECGEE